MRGFGYGRELDPNECRPDRPDRHRRGADLALPSEQRLGECLLGRGCPRAPPAALSALGAQLRYVNAAHPHTLHFLQCTPAY